MKDHELRAMFWEQQDQTVQFRAALPAEVFAPSQGFCPALACMDGGLTEIDGKPIAVRLAGSGALLRRNLDASRDAVVGIMDKYRLSYISYHDDCGAGIALAKQLGRPASDGDDLIEDFADSVAKVALADVVLAPLNRQPHQHTEVCHCYAGTRVAPHLGRLPAMFVTSRFVLGGSDYGKSELAMAAGIAFGPHGFGGLFTKDAPYTIVVVSTSQAQLGQYLAEVREVVAGLSDDIRERVAVKAFIGCEPVKL